MKNKHLVLIFLSVLAFGLVSRWLPFRYRTLFETKLLRLDSGSVDRMVIQVPGKPDLLFERVEHGWSVEQEGRATVVLAGTVSEMLGALTGIESFEIVKTSRPDTLGLASETALCVRLYNQKHPLEILEIGDERTTPDGAYTYLRLPEHAGVYRVSGHLRMMFGRALDDFRSRVVVNWTADEVQQVEFDFDGWFSLSRTDTTWHMSVSCGELSMPEKTVKDWLELLQQLNGRPFADYFDESWENELLYGTIKMTVNNEEQTLRLFFGSQADIPDDINIFAKHHIKTLPAYVVHSSANPLNYFAVNDTSLVRRISRGL